MFETTVDAWYVWLGVSLAGAAAFGVAASLPTTAPPDATAAARVVDGVADSRYAATGEAPLSRATEIRLSPAGIGLRGAAGAAHASFRAESVTPVGRDERLRRVLDGARPGDAFAGPESFRAATRSARARAPAWRPAPETLRVRHVTWRGIDVTLVG
ncbi:DUF7283 family protein [Halorarius halobius]|uniref:DUF7283 family protein n=1 Tax=Halorarius halobius TaxID=2962671 RepID=UPI0020CD028E|nr:hypothetical protein [Halorarius halobius]